ncbi:hypothetical protein AB0383_28575 [Amycolatopsis sp. NPDC051373]|uniref:hypothetical protein n=1 Tax=Amycolatopsis sp. NPDC051373 TaxID=3155801 RepID=UPI00344E31AE
MGNQAQGRVATMRRDNDTVAADAETFDDAVADMVGALREYADDWQDHLRDAPTHRDNWSLVQLIELSSDADLQAWLVNSSR